MDAGQLAAEVVEYVAPMVPYLTAAGGAAVGKLADGAGEAFGEGVWEHAKRLWARLRPAVESSPLADAAVTDVVDRPDDGDAKAALRLQVRKLLEHDDELARDVAGIWAQTRREDSVANFIGNTFGQGAVVAGRDISGDVRTLNLGAEPPK